MFDEISPHLLLEYQKHRGGKISGTRLSQKLADHAMVFMIRELNKKWKQLVSYYFSQNGMANVEIAKRIMIVVRHLYNLGLQVDTTVCDQYSKAAINHLVEETRQNFSAEETYTNSINFLWTNMKFCRTSIFHIC